MLERPLSNTLCDVTAPLTPLQFLSPSLIALRQPADMQEHPHLFWLWMIVILSSLYNYNHSLVALVILPIKATQYLVLKWYLLHFDPAILVGHSRYARSRPYSSA